jgi:hypothetical protein
MHVTNQVQNTVLAGNLRSFTTKRTGYKAGRLVAPRRPGLQVQSRSYKNSKARACRPIDHCVTPRGHRWWGLGREEDEDALTGRLRWPPTKIAGTWEDLPPRKKRAGQHPIQPLALLWLICLPSHNLTCGAPFVYRPCLWVLHCIDHVYGCYISTPTKGTSNGMTCITLISYLISPNSNVPLSHSHQCKLMLTFCWPETPPSLWWHFLEYWPKHFNLAISTGNGTNTPWL